MPKRQPLYPHVPKSRKQASEPATEEENLTPRAIKEGRHPYHPPEAIPAKVYPVRASTGEGYSLFDMTEGVWFGRRSATYQEAVERADRENRRLWEAYKALHSQGGHSEQPIATEMTIYNDGTYRVALRANGQYTIEEYEPENRRWYAMATGDNKYMRQIAEEYGLHRLSLILG